MDRSATKRSVSYPRLNESRSNNGQLRFGTSSWSSKGWVGPFYPEGMDAKDFLAHYAKEFDVVEADVTYYRIPDEKLVSGWNERTPDGFVICAKFPRSIVHCGEDRLPDKDKVLNLQDEGVQADTEEFLAGMSLLGEKCGPLVLQFPYFNKQVFPSRFTFLERLDGYLEKLPKNFRYAVEVRNKWWLKLDLLELLRKHDVAFVLTDISYMPHPANVARELDVLTTDFTYVRLIGDREEVERKTRTFDRIVVDREIALKRWKLLLEKLLGRVPLAWVFANNHFAGHAPATIRTLAEMVGRA